MLEFATYNVVAQPDPQGAADVPDMKFERIRDPSILETYSRYGISRHDLNDLPVPGPSVTVHVDREGCCDAILEEGDFFGVPNSGHHLKGFLPHNYWGGVLDQYYLLESDNTFGQAATVVPIGKDGRVGGYDGEPGRGDPSNTTGRNRKTFGIELDGVLYDPRNVLSIFLKSPNGLSLLNLPVVRGGPTAPTPLLTDVNLLPDVGGTSGGFFDVDPAYVGSFHILAKTPGADYPGLYAGYLIQETPQDFPTAYLGVVEKNINNLLLTRNANPRTGVGVTAPPIEEPGSGEIAGGPRRRLMGYATNVDRKEPISTAIRAADRFLITTDPPGLEPVRVKAALMIRERLLSAAERVDLLAATQSRGFEGHIKVVYDSVVDLVKEAVAAAVLTTMTEGGYLAQCAPEIGSTLFGEAFDVVMGLTQAELMADPLNPNERWAGRVLFAQQFLKTGIDTTLPFDNGVKVSVRDVAKLLHAGFSESNFADWVLKNNRVPQELRKFGFRNALATKFVACKLAKLPFTKAAEALKNVVTVAELGGGGAGDAFGYKTLAIAIPAEARDDPNAPGVYIAAFSVGQGITALPLRQADASEFTSQFFDFDSDAVSDRELVRTLQDHINDPNKGQDARRTLEALRKGMIRRPDLQGAVIPYDTYLLRYGYVPQLEVVVAPKGRLPSGSLMGDYTFVTGATEVPISFSSVVSALRTNQNATASASVRSEGYEVIPFRAVIQPPSCFTSQSPTCGGDCPTGQVCTDQFFFCGCVTP